MTNPHVAQRANAALAMTGPIYEFAAKSIFAQQAGNPNVCDFAFGNPHEMPLGGFVHALKTWVVPQNKDWFAYKDNEAPARKTVAESLRNRRGMPFDAEDVFLTTGAFGAISVALHTLVDPGDEVIFNSPCWFFYEPMIAAVGGVPVRVKTQPGTFDLDLEAIGRAMTSKTRAIFVNSPCNPTGKVYPPETLTELARRLNEASERNGRTIYLLSDESYSRVIFDGQTYPSPAAYYPSTVVLYTYGKVLLTPGQRIGYLALPPDMPNRDRLRDALFVMQIVTGWTFPNALLQHAIGDLDTLSIDIAHLQAKRDRMVGALWEIGYQVHQPDGTFYLLPRSPWEDDWAFTELLAEYDILCMPGTVVEQPGYFRISLTANDEMIERALPGFEKAMDKAKKIKHTV
jgi:aspartate aminotransferase